MDKQIQSYLTRISPSPPTLAQDHSDWALWMPPKEQADHQRFRDRTRERLNVLAKLALAAIAANKSDSPEKAEVGMIKYALSCLKPLAQQITDARNRKATIEERLRATSAKLKELEDLHQDLEDDLSDARENIQYLENLEQERQELGHAPMRDTQSRGQPPPPPPPPGAGQIGPMAVPLHTMDLKAQLQQQRAMQQQMEDHIRLITDQLKAKGLDLPPGPVGPCPTPGGEVPPTQVPQQTPPNFPPVQPAPQEAAQQQQQQMLQQQQFLQWQQQQAQNHYMQQLQQALFSKGGLAKGGAGPGPPVHSATLATADTPWAVAQALPAQASAPAALPAASSAAVGAAPGSALAPIIIESQDLETPYVPPQSQGQYPSPTQMWAMPETDPIDPSLLAATQPAGTPREEIPGPSVMDAQ